QIGLVGLRKGFLDALCNSRTHGALTIATVYDHIEPPIERELDQISLNDLHRAQLPPDCLHFGPKVIACRSDMGDPNLARAQRQRAQQAVSGPALEASTFTTSKATPLPWGLLLARCSRNSAAQQVGGCLVYTGCGANPSGKAAGDPIPEVVPLDGRAALMQPSRLSDTRRRR